MLCASTITYLSQFSLIIHSERKKDRRIIYIEQKKIYRYRILSFGRTNGVHVGRIETPILLLDTLFRSKRGSREEFVSFIIDCCDCCDCCVRNGRE